MLSLIFRFPLLMFSRGASVKSFYDPSVLVSAAITMQRIQDDVCSRQYASHSHYISGAVHISKAMGLVRKLDSRFGLNLSKDQRYRRRAKGECTFSLHLYPADETDSIEWILLRTGGDHPKLDSEQWRCLRTAGERLEFFGFELIELSYTHREIEQQKAKGRSLRPTSWTWQMTQAKYEGFKKRIRSAVARLKNTKGKNTLLYEQVCFSISRCPGFRRVSDQVWGLRGYINECRRRVQMGPDVFPPVVPLRKRRCAEYPLSVLAERWRAGESSFFPPAARGTSSGIVTRTAKGAGT